MVITYLSVCEKKLCSQFSHMPVSNVHTSSWILANTSLFVSLPLSLPPFPSVSLKGKVYASPPCVLASDAGHLIHSVDITLLLSLMQWIHVLCIASILFFVVRIHMLCKWLRLRLSTSVHFLLVFSFLTALFVCCLYSLIIILVNTCSHLFLFAFAKSFCTLL